MKAKLKEIVVLFEDLYLCAMPPKFVCINGKKLGVEEEVENRF
jgi:hypothetical protein